MADYLTITEAADKLAVPPRRISDLLYARKVDLGQLLVKGNRRLISPKLFVQIERLLTH